MKTVPLVIAGLAGSASGRLATGVLLFALLLATPNAHSAPGDLFVSDAQANSILRFTPGGIQTTFVTGLDNPLGLAFDTNGSLFEADNLSGNIFEFTPAGDKSTFASGLNQPDGLAFNSSGDLFVAEFGTGSILRFTQDGTKTTFVSGLNGPLNLAFDAWGNLFVSNDGDGSIQKLSPAGVVTRFASGLTHPRGIAFDSAGNLYVSITGGRSIFKFSPDATMTTFASDPPFPVSFPRGLAFDADGNLFQVNGGDGMILKFTPDVEQSSFASGLGEPVGLAFEPVTEKLRNISARGLVGTDDGVLIGGFIVGGNPLANNAIVVRAIGPSLAQAGVTNPLADPTLELHNSSGAVIATNNDWQDSQEEQITASGLAPTDPNESAIFATLPAGGYTAVVSGADDETGVALVEVYSVAQ
jgi:sugar lactone lactonase YvrE